MSLPQSDDFNRANSNPIGGNWTTGFGDDCQILTNKFLGTQGFYNSALWNADAFTNDQYSQCTIWDQGGSGLLVYSGPTVRLTAGGTGYIALCNTSGSGFGPGDIILQYITSRTGGVGLATYPNTCNIGDTIKLTIVGTTLSTYVNGSLIGTVTDSSASSGSAGLGAYTDKGFLDDWTGGNIISGGGSIQIPSFRSNFNPTQRSNTW